MLRNLQLFNRHHHRQIDSDSDSYCSDSSLSEDDNTCDGSVDSRTLAAPAQHSNSNNELRTPLRKSNDVAISNTNGEPTSPWGTGKTKKIIVDALRNQSSDIHLYYEERTDDGGIVINYTQILNKYAPNHNMKNFRPNIKRLIENKKNKTGPFKEGSGGTSGVSNGVKQVDPWFTSSKKISLGYTLLHDMYMFDKRTKSMKVDEIWASQPQFQLYPLKDFKTYNNNMKKLVAKKLQRASIEESIYEEDMLHHPKKLTTCRGTPFWSAHEARKLLSKDVDDGIDQRMPPRLLWKEREEYQEFPLSFFRKRIYEVRSKKVGGPYWQAKRNKNAMKLHRIETDRLRKEWIDDIELVELMKGMRIGDNEFVDERQGQCHDSKE